MYQNLLPLLQQLFSGGGPPVASPPHLGGPLPPFGHPPMWSGPAMTGGQPSTGGALPPSPGPIRPRGLPRMTGGF